MGEKIGMELRTLRIEVEEEELKNIFQNLREAQETIWKCYSRLEMLGVIKMIRAAESDSPVNN